jgi:hypothetical protein
MVETIDILPTLIQGDVILKTHNLINISTHSDLIGAARLKTKILIFTAVSPSLHTNTRTTVILHSLNLV